MSKKIRFSWKKGVAIAVVMLLGGLLRFYISVYHQPIQVFDAQRDMQSVLTLFERNRYWLTATPNYDAEYTFTHQSPNKNPLNSGMLATEVMRSKQGEFIGFASYYMKSLSLGTVLFLAVEESFRGKRYAQILLEHSVQQLIARGATRIELVTRPSNISAQRVYSRVGFHETGRDETFVYFEYIP